MKFDFTSIMDRKGKDAIAVDMVGAPGGFAPEAPGEGFDVIPMWVADMNFATAPGIQDAIIERVKHPAFGYFEPRDEYYKAIIDWQRIQNGVTGLNRENIGYENGVLGGVISALNAFCSKGDKVLLHSPTYIGFTNALTNNGYSIVHSPLIKDKEGVFRMDYEDMERKITKEKIHAAIICSPHNPCGRVWEREELEKAYEIFERHHVFVISDEIWSDIILGSNKHTTSQSVSLYAHDNTVALYAPSKTFNLAGLIGSYHIIYNDYIRDRVAKESSLCHYNDMNILSMYALMGAFTDEGREWLKELREVLTANIDYACDFVRNSLPGVTVSKPQGTYMLWLDCSEYCKTHGKTIEEIEKACWNVGVALQDGNMFNGEFNVRVNLALPLSRVKEAFDRMKKYVFTE